MKNYNSPLTRLTIHEKKFLEEAHSLELFKSQEINFCQSDIESIISLYGFKPALKFNRQHSSYGIKHLFEHLSALYYRGWGYKYCSMETAIDAFVELGFGRAKAYYPNYYFNISRKELNAFSELVMGDKRFAAKEFTEDLFLKF